ncbi:cysteine hydrolase family protein [Nocardia inohanensis]|uniref:cysteine hydrolase family protein n=1 Tax=Nocardia inohanensis TaxID=209246 RepID=UPI00082D99D1|nr:cysteine hydrolase family protein [Nocardia inohanensis]
MRRALLVIDVQNEYISGKLPIAYPPLDISLGNIAAAMDTAVRAGIPIAMIQHTAPPESPLFAVGSAGFALHPVVAERPFDVLFEKTMPSSFTGTGLGDWLAAHDIDTVVIAGYMTQNCDESTAREAVHRGLAVEFLSDATGTLGMANEAGNIGAKELHEAVLVTLQSRFAAVCTTREWIDAVAGGPEPVRSGILASTAVSRA